MLVHKEISSKEFIEFFFYHFAFSSLLLHFIIYQDYHVFSWPTQRRLWARYGNFDTHAFCARCREKGKGMDDCAKNPQSANCSICNAFSEDQRIQLATPSYRIKKEKREAKKLESTPVKDTEALVDPTSVSVIGPIDKPTPAKPALEAQPPFENKERHQESR